MSTAGHLRVQGWLLPPSFRVRGQLLSPSSRASPWTKPEQGFAPQLCLGHSPLCDLPQLCLCSPPAPQSSRFLPDTLPAFA